MRYVVLFLVALLLVALLPLSGPLFEAEHPRLVVIVGVDQLRPDRLNRELPGGLGRLMREGYVYTRATLDHGLTSTCPGHIVMSTGVNPARAGIPGNSYIDHQTMAERYCVDDSDAAFKVHGTSDIRSPNAITATTLGDWLKQSSTESRVFAISGKDRAAISLGGKSGDGVFWFNTGAGKFTSSGYYGDLPDYVNEFNGEQYFVDGYGGKAPETWEHPAGSYRPDDYVGEAVINLRVSGHPVNQGEPGVRADRYYFSPWLDIATAELAKIVLEQEQLGQRGVTDYLGVSFSATDVVGHLYGPYSAESEDALNKLDAALGDLMKALDEKLGGDYVLALTADHGVLPLPEWLVETGDMQCPIEGGRLDLESFGIRMLRHLDLNFTRSLGNPSDLVGFSAAGATVNKAYADELGVTVDEVVASLETWLEKQDHVVNAWTKDELMHSDDPTARLFRNSYVDGKSGHIIIQLAQTCLAFRPEGTSHGSVYLYDRHVPLIFFGQGVATGSSDEARHSIDIAPTLGARLGLRLPDNLDGQSLNIWKGDPE